MPGPVRIRRVPPPLPAAWDDLARADGSPWQAAAFADLYERCGTRPVHLLAEIAGAPAGALTVFRSGSRRLPALDRPLGCFAHVFDEPAVADPAAVLPLVDAAVAAARTFGAVEIDFLVQRPRRLDPAALADRGFAVVPEGMGLLELPEVEADVDHLLRRMARRKVRSAREAGVVVEAGAAVDRLLPLLDRSFTRSGLSARDPGFVRAFAAALGGEVLVASRGGRDLAALLFAEVAGVALNAFHGRVDGEETGASHLLHREMLVRGRRRGARLVHTGGMALPGETDGKLLGISRFKASLGFVAEAGFRGRKVLRPASRRLRRALVGLRARLGGGT